jgi:hypothetical protein
MSSILADQQRPSIYMRPNAEGRGGGGVAGSQPMSTGCAQEPKYVNCGDLTTYLTYGVARQLAVWHARVRIFDRHPRRGTFGDQTKQT